MTPEDLDQLYTSIINHEGFASQPISDSKKSQTIGYGHSLTFSKITPTAAKLILDDDVYDRMKELIIAWPTFLNCDGPRQRVLLEMAYQLGVSGLMEFKKMLHAVAIKDYKTAKLEILNSRLANETPTRARDYVALMGS